MKLRATLATALAALALPAAALAVDPSPSDRAAAQQSCRAQRTALGPAAFKALYGANENDRNAFGKCVSKLARAEQKDPGAAAAERREVAAAAKACRAEREQNAAAFREKYGTNRNKANAFGKCVAAAVHA